jgi:hypothetical protein
VQGFARRYVVHEMAKLLGSVPEDIVTLVYYNALVRVKQPHLLNVVVGSSRCCARERRHCRAPHQCWLQQTIAQMNAIASRKLYLAS